MPFSSAPQHELALIVESEIPLQISEAQPPEARIAERMQKVKEDLFQHMNGEEHFAKRTGDIIRAAVDYVIDAPTLYRYSVTDLEPDEKTAVGKRIERMIRFHFDIPRGKKLDLTLAGEDVDIKTTMGRNWMFSKSSHDRINLLIAYDEEKAEFRVGLAYVEEHQLNAENRDSKRSLSSEHRANISWIVENEPYAPNFLAHLPELVKEIKTIAGGTNRVLHLLRKVKGRAIPRHVICSVANQKDPLRRVRSNGGARDVLWKEKLMVLSGAYTCDRDIVSRALGIELERDEMLTLDIDDSRLATEMISSYCDAHALA
ncbi:NaeI family type II restriction endonuclease [Massilia sp. Leaf139]|uniref:NaeI family type II restriction endonuclease n=1 Tax=Massilia sp. Leaf139 TaxID=1736272 RepID=UPI0006FDC12B|nr:NaeI family type II restriction endonuclease [Massilia sp. Leaf139]KQQ96134.1 hypothetical protein ASF77_21760 [Massilia sp. Leaf139]